MSRARIAVIVVVLLLAAGAAALASESTLRWIARELEQRTNGDLVLANPKGSLLTHAHLDRIAWRGVHVDVDAEDVTVALAPWWLLAGKVAFRHAEARSLAIVRKPSAPSGPPLEHLHVPGRLRFDNATVTTFTYAPSPGDVHAFGRAAFDLDFGARNWSLALRRLASPQGVLTGNGTLGTNAPFPLRGQFDLVHAAGDGRGELHTQASIDGDLHLLAVQGKLEGARTSVIASMKIAPGAPQPLNAIDANIASLDLHDVAAGLPSSALAGTMRADTGADGVLRGRIEIDNREPGTIDAKRLPITRFTGDLATETDRWRLTNVVASVGNEGRLTGEAWVAAHEIGARVAAAALDLSQFHSALKPTSLSGEIVTEGPAQAQHVRASARDRALRVAVDATFAPQRVEIRQARASAGGGSATVAGTLAFDGQRNFRIDGTLARFDPSAFGKYPKARINAKVNAEGALLPVLQVHGGGTLASSTLFGVPASGKGTWASRGEHSPAVALDASARLGATIVAVKGTIKDPADLKALDLDLALSGANLADLWPITGLPYPDTGPYRVAGKLAYHERVWSLRKFEGTVGRSDLEGDFVVDLSNERPRMTGDLASRRLDIRDLGGFIGAGAPHRRVPNRVLSQTAFDLHHLNAAEVDVRFNGRSIRNERLPLHAMNAHFVLDHGRVTIDPLQFKAAGGDLDARITLDARKAPIRGVADVQARAMKLNRLAPGVKAMMSSSGTIDARTRLELEGNSVADMFASADGKLVLAMNGGSISDVMLRLANLDLANTLVAMAKGNQSIPVNCLVADFQAHDGVFEPRTLVLDSEHTIVHGTGTIDMHTERLALQLEADPKDGSVLALRGPIRIEGVLAKPAVHPDLRSTIARTGAGALLAAIAPPLAILPFLERGKPEKVDCHPLIVEASRFLRTREHEADASGAAAAPAASPQAVHDAVRSRKAVAGARERGVPVARNP